MSERRARKMLRQMASGKPVRVSCSMVPLKEIARIAFVAEQFGYAYSDISQSGGPKGKGYVLSIAPDPGPQARARAERNRARYPDAVDGGALPPVTPEAVELLNIRMRHDLAGSISEKQRIALVSIGFTALALSVCFNLGADTSAVAVTGSAWAVLMTLSLTGIKVGRRYTAGYAAQLQAAGYVQVTEKGGRVRYVPQSVQPPGGAPLSHAEE
ncbi:hypothetical protein [Streptomyces sp. NPDC127066]|uniref:hypothetical protein n=1 Tax=Streptomyces sp. NPDC127066 TaxID=3347125 RepID=UPI0036642DEA